MIDIEQLKRTREKVIKLENKIDALSEIQDSYISELCSIQNTCSHEVGVKFKGIDEDAEWPMVDAYCLCCNDHFTSIVGDFTNYFGDGRLINFENLDCNDELNIEDKVQLALNMFLDKKREYPDMSVTEIVSLINEEIEKDLYSDDLKQIKNDMDILNNKYKELIKKVNI